MTPPPAPHIDVVARERPARFEESLHVHPETALLVYAEAGAFGVRTDGALWLASPGCAVWSPVDCASGVVTSRAPVRFRSLHVRAPLPADLPRAPQVLRVRAFFGALIGELGRLSPGRAADAERAAMIGRLILHEIAAAAALPAKLRLPTDESLTPAVSALHAAPARPLGVGDAARLCKMGERTFARRFTAATGLGWGRWRNEVRLLNAQRLLEQGASVGEAARDSGYDSPSALTAAFVRRFGVTPRQVRSRARQVRDGVHEPVDVSE